MKQINRSSRMRLAATLVAVVSLIAAAGCASSTDTGQSASGQPSSPNDAAASATKDDSVNSSSAVSIAGSGSEVNSNQQTTSTKDEEGGGSQLNAMLPSEIRDSGVLKAGVAPVFEPATFYPPGTKKLSGYDPELLQRLGEVLDVKVEMNAVAFEALITGVASKRFDIAATGISDTLERQKQVTFVDIYDMRKEFVTLKKSGDIVNSDITSACDETIGIQAGTIDSDRLEDVLSACKDAGLDEPQVVKLPDSAAKKLALQSGRVSLVFYSTVDVPVLNKHSDGAFVGTPVDALPSALAGIAISKDRVKLQKAVQAGINAMIEDGSYQKILNKWEVGDLAVTHATINGTS